MFCSLFIREITDTPPIFPTMHTLAQIVSCSYYFQTILIIHFLRHPPSFILNYAVLAILAVLCIESK